NLNYMERVLQCVRLPQGKKGTIGFNLKGEYLKMFGFKQGDKAKVEINENKIVISKIYNVPE
ncbi:MAG: hypothetical protein E6834_22405, partial [Bacteroides ovatus]|nr:hypothetical protein [Bacteroides ovatus]